MAMLCVCMALGMTGCMPGGEDTPVDPGDSSGSGSGSNGGDNTGGGNSGDTTDPITIYDFTLYADTGTNISGIRYTSSGRLVSDGETWRFCNVGTVSFIDKITTIPWSSWDSSVGVSANTGIVAYHPTIGYMSMYVSKLIIDEGGRVMGIYIIYCPGFNGLDAPVELQTTEINAPAEGLTVDIPITSKTFTPFKVSVVDNEWCSAQPKAINGVFMPSRIAVTIAPNDSYDMRETRIVVGSVYGKNTIITVNQEGLYHDDEE